MVTYELYGIRYSYDCGDVLPEEQRDIYHVCDHNKFFLDLREFTSVQDLIPVILADYELRRKTPIRLKTISKVRRDSYEENTDDGYVSYDFPLSPTELKEIRRGLVKHLWGNAKSIKILSN